VLTKVNLRFVNLTAVVVKKQFLLKILAVFSLCYPGCKAHAPCYIFNCGLSPCAVCFTLFWVQSIFKKINIKCASEFFGNFSWNTFYFKKNWHHIFFNACVPFIKYPTCLSKFKATWFSTNIFEKYWNIYFNDSSPGGIRVVSIGKQT
jgi:hypothetical protein